MSDHVTPGGPKAGTPEGGNGEPLSTELVLSEADDLVQALLAAVLKKDADGQKLLTTMISQLDENGLGFFQALEFLTTFRLRYVPVQALVDDAEIIPNIAIRDGLDAGSQEQWRIAIQYASQLWSARANSRRSPAVEVRAKVNLRKAPLVTKGLVLMVMAIDVAGMIEHAVDVQGRGYDVLETLPGGRPADSLDA